jgi:hypothetical protein
MSGAGINSIHSGATVCNRSARDLLFQDDTSVSTISGIDDIHLFTHHLCCGFWRPSPGRPFLPTKRGDTRAIGLCVSPRRSMRMEQLCSPTTSAVVFGAQALGAFFLCVSGRRFTRLAHQLCMYNGFVCGYPFLCVDTMGGKCV